jgi:hypothetical protein
MRIDGEQHRERACGDRKTEIGKGHAGFLWRAERACHESCTHDSPCLRPALIARYSALRGAASITM